MLRNVVLLSGLLTMIAACARDQNMPTEYETIRVGPMTAQFDLDTLGCMAGLQLGKKSFFGNPLPPLAGAVLESASYDQYRDFVPDAKLIVGKYEVVSFENKSENNATLVTYKGKLTFGADAILADIVWKFTPGSPVIEMSVQLQPEGAFTNRYIRELSIQLPTAFNFRKRIVEGGDQGWQFDSRNFYQFHLDTSGHLMPEPEHNHWNLFMVEQDSPLYFRDWRAESLSTPPMVIQHGHQAAGWMAEYDEQGGLLFAYRNIDKRAPKALAVNAAGGGLAQVFLQAPGWKAISPNGAAAKALLWGDAHRIDAIPFEGAFTSVKPQALLAKAWGVEKLPSDPPAAPKLLDLDLWNAPAAADARAPMVIGGLPIPRGALHAAHARLWKNDSEIPLQTKPLAFWPDGSVKWMLLIFPLQNPGVSASANDVRDKLLPFNVTLRAGGKQEFVLEYGDFVESRAKPAKRLTASEQDGKIDIDTGVLHLSLTTGEKWLQDVSLDGKPVLRDPAQPLSFADFLRVTGTYPTNSAHPTGELDPGAVKIDSIVLEEKGPLRAMVRLEGYAQAKEPARIILRIEAYAGQSALRVFHTVEFLHKDPRKVFLRSMGFRLPLALDAETTRVSFGGQDGPKDAPKSARTGLLETSHLNFRAWSQEKPKAEPSTVEEKHRCRGWMTMGDANLACTVVLRNMWQEYPKELVADSATGELSAYLWPESVPLMDVRRYSNYPHPSQGESAGSENWWVAKDYYQDSDRGPFIGVSKTHELLIWFHDPNVPPAQVDAVASDFQSPPLVYVTPEYYAKAGITLPYRLEDKERFPKVERNIANVFDFILFHQKMWAWYGMWDFGDIGHRFAQGYGATVKPDSLIELLKKPVAERAKVDIPDKNKDGAYVNLRDWDFDNGRWGWSNTEGLFGLSLQLYYLRTGRRDIFFAAEAMARNVRDVDMRHDGKYFGCGTRHGVQHWSDGDHEERQVVASEYRFYHYLTGDMRCRDFLKQLTDKAFMKGRCEGAADHSGRLYGLFTYWEMTGDKQVAETLKNYTHCFIIPEGIDISPPVEFPSGKRFDPKPREPNGSVMWYHTFGCEHALMEYQQATGDKELADAIIRMATKHLSDKDFDGNFRKTFAFAALHAPDPAPFRDAMTIKWPKNGWESPLLYQCVTDNRKHWTGETALMCTEMSFTLFYLQDIFHVLAALEQEPVPVLDRIKRMEAKEKNGNPHSSSDGSMQSEFDRPELKAFLDERPWPKELGQRKP